jgi:hypothetical protein
MDWQRDPFTVAIMRFLPGKMVAVAAIVLGTTAAVAPSALAGSASASSITPVPSSPVSASASTGAGATTLAEIKAKASAAISRRDSALQRAISTVTANEYLTSSDKATVLATLNSDLTGLNALAPVIQSDSTVTKARSDYKTIFTSYRVFALALPQARLAAAADDLTGKILPRLTHAQSRLQGLLSGRDSAKNTPAVQAAIADLAKQINAITAATDGLAAAVLADTPAGWNANHAILSQPRSQLVSARADARAARRDIKTVVTALK